MVEKRAQIANLWRNDLVAFLIGCSLTFETALIEAGVPVRNVECDTLVLMFIPNFKCRRAGRFRGPIVVTMRPVPTAQVQLANGLSACYPYAHTHSHRPPRTTLALLICPDPTMGNRSLSIRTR